MYENPLLDERQIQVLAQSSPDALLEYIQECRDALPLQQAAILSLGVCILALQHEEYERVVIEFAGRAGLIDAQAELLTNEITKLADGHSGGELATLISRLTGTNELEALILMELSVAKLCLLELRSEQETTNALMSPEQRVGLFAAIRRFQDHRDQEIRNIVHACQLLADSIGDMLRSGGFSGAVADSVIRVAQEHADREFIPPLPEQLRALESGFNGVEFTVLSGFAKLDIKCVGLRVVASVLANEEFGTVRITAQPDHGPTHIYLDLTQFPCVAIGDFGEEFQPERREGGSLYFRDISVGTTCIFLPRTEVA